MNNKNTLSLALLFLLLTLSISSALSAYIGGPTGSPKAIVNGQVGEILERVLPVKNVNNVSVSITLKATGDLANYTKIIENDFVLEPGEEKDVHYLIGIAKNGSTRTDIFVSFKPESGYSVGALATITVRANETISGYSEQKLIQELEEKSKSASQDNSNDGNTGNTLYYFLIPTLILVIILVILFIFLTKNKKRAKMNA